MHHKHVPSPSSLSPKQKKIQSPNRKREKRPTFTAAFVHSTRVLCSLHTYCLQDENEGIHHHQKGLKSRRTELKTHKGAIDQNRKTSTCAGCCCVAHGLCFTCHSLLRLSIYLHNPQPTIHWNIHTRQRTTRDDKEPNAPLRKSLEAAMQ
jgi:hypothetical protein